MVCNAVRTPCKQSGDGFIRIACICILKIAGFAVGGGILEMVVVVKSKKTYAPCSRVIDVRRDDRLDHPPAGHYCLVRKLAHFVFSFKQRL
jgi:hypothetical protein